MKIENLTLSELVKLNDRITAALPIVRARELEAARKEMRALAESKGFAISDLIGTAPKARSSRGPDRKPATKMRDAKGIVYVGRGRLPKGYDKASAVAA